MRERILKVATELIRRDGAGGATARLVCEAAGIKAPTLYYYFGDMEGLREEVVARAFAQILEGSSAGWRSESGIEGLRRSWETYLSFARHEPALFAILANRIVTGPLPTIVFDTLAQFEATFAGPAFEGRLRYSSKRSAHILWAAAQGAGCLLLAGQAGVPINPDLGGDMFDTVMDSLMPARVMEGSTRADIQVYGTPATMGVKIANGVPKYQFEDKPGIQSSFYQCRPQSRGTLHITSASPQTAPVIHVNYMDHPHDRAVALGGFRLCRKILAQPAFDSIRGEELSPGAAIQTDDEILGYMQASASTVYHLVGTCKMGDDALAVVDNRLRVIGTTGLRVVDSSIMPQIVSGNTHATTIMIAEKGADMILEDAGRAA